MFQKFFHDEIMFIALDFGAVGARACVLDEASIPVQEERINHDMAGQTPEVRQVLHTLLGQIPASVAGQLQRITLIIAMVNYGWQVALSTLNSVTTCGGDAKNKAWQQIRKRSLGVTVSQAQRTEAVHGASMLARYAGIM